MELNKVREMEMLCEAGKKIERAVSNEFDKGIKEIDIHEMGKAVDMIKDFACAKESLAKAMYYCTLSEAMEENKGDYGKTWDEEGRYYTEPMHNNMGRERMTTGKYRDTTGRRYYTETPEVMADGEHTEMDRVYMDFMARNNTMSHTERMNLVDDFVKALIDDVSKMANKLNSEEKQVVKSRLQVLIQQL